MVRRDGAAIRRERIQEITRHIMSKLHEFGELPYRATIVYFQYQYGLTRGKIQDYIAIPQQLGRFHVDEEKDKILRAPEKDQT